MVADIRERSRRLLAATVLALVLAAALPVAPAQPDLPNGATSSAGQIRVEQAEVQLFQGSAFPTHFVTGNESNGARASVTVRLPVYNDGATAMDNIPLYYWFDENATAIGCRAINVPAGDANSVGRNNTTFSFSIPRDVKVNNPEDPADDEWRQNYTMRILVNREPKGVPAFDRNPAEAKGQTCATAAPNVSGSLLGGGCGAASTDCDSTDNLVVTYFVVDAKLDLVLDPAQGVKWCRGNATQARAANALCDDNVDKTNEYHWKYTSDRSNPDAAGGGQFNTTRNLHPAPTECPEDNTPAGPVPDVDCERADGPENPYEVNNETYFEFHVRNNVPADPETPGATWFDPTDYSSPNCVITSSLVQATGATLGQTWTNKTHSSCPPLKFDVDVRVGAPGTDVRRTGIVLTNRSVPVEGFGVARSVTWHTSNWTGPFVVYATVNDRGAVRETSLTNNDILASADAEGRAYEVAWVDFVPSFVESTLPTTTSNPLPYPSNREITIAGQVLLDNLGTSAPWTFRHEYQADGWRRANEWNVLPTAVDWRVTLDNLTAAGASRTGTGNACAARYDNEGQPVDCHTATPPSEFVGNHTELLVNPWYGNFSFRYSTDPTASDYLPPGKHSLCLTVDVGNRTRETNEQNNAKCIAIYLADVRVPVFDDIAGKTNPRITREPAYDANTTAALYPGEPFFVHSNATDDDLASLNVTAQFTLATNASVVRNYTMNRNPQFQASTWTSYIKDFNFTGPNGTSENWTLRVVANDSFGNIATSPPTPFELKRWPIQTAHVDEIVVAMHGNGTAAYPDGYAFNYSDDTVLVRWRIVVLENQTGVKDQPNVTENLGIRFFTPKNTTYFVNGSGFSKLIDCPRDTLPVGGSRGSLGCTEIGHFYTPHAEKDEGGPGRWYAHIEIKDSGGDLRVINRTFVLQDAAPTLSAFTVTPLELDAGNPVNVTVNMTDDFAVDVDNGGARVNFTRRGDNKTFSIELNGPPSSVEGGVAKYSFNRSIETGFGKPLDEAGEFDVVGAARDNQGNWATTLPIRIKVNDVRAPDLHEAGPDLSAQEVGQNVTFTARVTDQTNVTVRLRVHPTGSDEDVLNVLLDPTGLASTNYTHTANFTREGNYVWEIFARDSAGLTSSVKTGPLTIADNLGPRFQVVEPGYLKEGKRYGRTAPLVSLIVSDTHGVDRDSVNLTIAGQKVTHDAPVATGGGLNGYIVNYTVPASERFEHGEVVVVNVTALDLSGRTLRGYANFTFTVDDAAPTVRVKEFSPRFPLEGAGTINVSLKTRFTLEAGDQGDPSTGVESIRYTIFGGGNNAAETVYNDEPFTIADVPGVYTGPKVYQIQYWAVDGVGNRKTTSGRPSYETLTVYVDGLAPSLDQFASLPEGQYINATVIDERSGVDRVIAWYSVNGAPYVPMPLDFVAGIWKGVLPEGRKGDTVAYYLEAFDRVENRETFGNATVPYTTYEVGNHNPSIQITQPATGSTIARTVDLRWNASDEDGDPLVFTIYVKEPGSTTFRELAKLESNDARRYPLDTTDFVDGEYTFRVSVNDGSRNADASTTVTILNRASAFGTVTRPPGEVDAGTPVVLQVEVTKAQATVEARIYLDDRLVQAYPMNDEGRDGDEVARDGKYSARVLMDDNGRYRVEFHARYQEDGVQKEATIAGGEFVVQGGGFGGISGIGWLLVGVGLLVVVGVAVAAVVLVRGRK